MQEIIAGLLLSIIGLLLLFFPDKVFQITEKWKFRNNDMEMSSTYKGILGIVGAVFVVMGIIVFVTGLLF